MVTVVNGTTLTGLYDADGSINIFDTTNESGVWGMYHPCGALNVFGVDGTSPVGYYAANGAINVITGTSPGKAQHPSGALQIDSTLITTGLLLESGDFILLEDGSFILQE